MADNIKIVGNIVSTTTISRYSESDINLIPSKRLIENFGGTNDYIEFYVYDIAGNLLNTNYNYLNYKLPPDIGLTPGVTTQPNTTGEIQTVDIGIDSTLATPTSSLYPIIEIDPVTDLQNLGYSSGEFKTRYNFFQNRLSNYINEALFIKEISPDRTELRLASITLTNSEIESVTTALIKEIDDATYYVDYLLNFGDNNQVVAVNVALNKAPEGNEVLFKLYQPLPLNIQEKQTLWVVEEIVSPYVFDINLDKLITPPPPPTLRGPNFDIEIPNQGTISTTYTDYSTSLLSLQSLQSSSYYQILNLMATQSIQINVDYTDFDNFVFFGSAYQRLANFYNKVKQIEDYTSLISIYTPYVATTGSLQTEINYYSSSINTLISQFDGYETYLYFESSSYTWPKSSSIKPFTLLPTGSATVISWYNALTGSAQEYDELNYDNLVYAIPNFLRDDDNNIQYLTFLNMVGQYFDNIWIYLKAITDINLANNNLNKGISKDLVYNQLQSLGIKLYNSQAGDSVANYLVGANTGSSAWDDNFSITGSYLNNIPRKDLVSELYKRIYHNLPLLLKQKGTITGLDNLITTFGIPVLNNQQQINCNLYTVLVSYGSTPSETVVNYIPCGQIDEIEYILPASSSTSYTFYIDADDSTLTPYFSTVGDGISITKIGPYSGILNIKEFGGSLKSNLVKGYNSDKVRIIENAVTGSVLSPILSLQTFPTASSAFRENDMHYVDISFSPETQIDTYISGAIASNNSTWVLDDYIGDPRQQYSGSYPDLDAQRKLYFQTGVPGYAPFTASLLDYNKFVRLIEFFDNSLFKMLADFVPERASLSTGVTINSPVLERNKAAYSILYVATQSVYTAQYSASAISSQYGTFYNALSASNNTMGWYDGEISGSTVNINQYFTDNYNPYLLGNTESYNASRPANQKINLNTFLHSDWNVLLNNVSSSVQSLYRQNIEYIWGTTGSILKPAELQDSYLSLRSYNVSRYEGSKTTSQLYNIYTDGDDSYGKTAAIDHTVRKIGLFTQIESSSFLPRRNNVVLKYLVDEFGGLTELNQRNTHWEEIQRTFIVGNTGSVSLFDNKKFGNQKSTDGQKLIFDSGYLYSPILYFSSCSADPNLSFQNTAEPNAYLIRAQNFSSSYYISGSSILGYPVSGGIGGAINNIFNYEIEDTNNIYIPGNFNAPPTYSVQETAQHKVYATVNLQYSSSATSNVTWSLQLYNGASLIAEDEKYTATKSTATASNAAAITTVRFSSTTINSTLVTSSKDILLGATNIPAGTSFRSWSGTYYTGSGCPTGPMTNVYSRVSLSNSSYTSFNQVCSFPNFYEYTVSDFWSIPEFSTTATNTSTTFTIDKGYTDSSTALNLTAGDKLYIKLALKAGSTLPSNYTASLSPGQGSLIIGSLALSTGYALTTCPYITTGSNTEIIFSAGLSSFYNSGYTFVPNPVTGSVSSLYSIYGDVDYSFSSKLYDIVILYLSDNSYVEARVIEIYTDSNNKIRLVLDQQLSQLAQDDIQNGNYKRFLLLSRTEDETNTYLVFTKRPGQTSYGFLIPKNLAPDVLANIDTITQQVKQRLVNDQGSIIGSIDGGGF